MIWFYRHDCDKDKKAEKPVLFITGHRLGDAVLSTATLARLVEQWPEARFTIVCGPDVADLFLTLPQCEQIILFHKRSWNRHWLALWAYCVKHRWFLVVDLRSSPVSLFLWAKQRVIVKGGRRAGHKISQHQQCLVEKFPFLQGEKEDQSLLWQPRLWHEMKKEPALPDSPRPYIALAPTAGSEDKIWPAEYFLALAERLRQAGYDIVFLYGHGAREARLMAPFRMSLARYKEYHDYGARERLNDVMSIIKECVLLVGNDSGLMHLAAASNIASLGLFGPTREEEYAPVGPYAYILSAKSGKEEGGNGPENMMTRLSVDRVYDKIMQILGRK